MLKRIELKGFKSFADKTVVDFERGVSCIVGPNGSGKSNITDAFRWVLGEQSYKSLRGKQMTDVIFNGTVSREALGYAEVIVVLDNSKNMIKLPYEEVSILRRLYRSGESVYSINENTCRLKDIKDLFLDTGVGVEGYSIIGQGRIDKLLSSGKEDRRAIFEEASGISKYKSKKEEAFRKLTKTSSHIERIEDIVSELELRVKPLKEQSEKASQYLNIKNELKSIEISIYLEDIDKIKSELEIYKKDLVKFETESEEIANNLFKTKDKVGTLSLEIDKLKEKKQVFVVRKNNLEKEKIKKDGYLKLVEERIELSSTRNVELDEKISSNIKFLDAGWEEKKLLETKYNEVNGLYLNKKIELDKLKQKFDSKNNELETLQSNLAIIKADKRNFFDNINKVEIERAEFKILIEQTEKRLAQLEAEIRVNEDFKQGTLEGLKDIQHRLNEIEKKENELRIKKVDVETIVSEKRISIEDIENKIYKLQSEKNESISKRDILENRIENFEGMTESAREVLKEAKNDNRVYGTIASLITIDKEYEIALEQILGARAENIVTADFDTAKKYIDFLKQNKLGRQSFLPLDDIRANNIIDIDDFDGMCGHAMDFIECDAEVEPAIRYLLYNVSFVENLDAAKKARQNAPNGYKLVTLQGEVVNVGGSVSGGNHKRRRSAVFSDKRILEEINNKIEKKELELEQFKNKREVKIKEIQKKAKEISDLQAKLSDYSSEKLSANTILDSERKRLSGGVKQEQKNIEEKNNILNSLEEFKQKLNINNNKELELRSENEKNNTDTDGIKKLIDDLRINISEFSNDINEKNIEVNRIEFELKNKEFEFKNHIQKLEKEKSELDILNKEKESLNTQIVKHNEEHSKKLEEIAENEKESLKLVKDINSIDVELNELGIRSNEDLNNYKNLEKKLNDLKDSMYGIRINTGKLETKLENQEQALWENYNLSYAGALEFKIEISYNKAKNLMRSYKNELKEIGDVNLLAIEEYKEVSERYEFMNSQKNDLQESLDKLNKIINEMEEKMRTTFKESLDAIKERFKVTFKDLFKGGMATIELSDDKDVLEAEIIINAQPPGKKLQTIELLSGGEKALTAIAILFAILKTKPAPFCILDEIEAALDDRNIDLFSSFLIDYKKDSQFIIISHRKGTIKIADALYGVTMKEKGISQMLSLKLEDGRYKEA